MASNRTREILKRVILLELCDDTDLMALKLVTDQFQLIAGFALQMCRTNEEENTDDAHIDDFVEETVPRYSASQSQFKYHFRMLPCVFEDLCNWVSPHLPPDRTVTTEKKMLAFLWLLASKESYRGVADRFCMNKEALHGIVKIVCQCLVALRGDVIKWPQRHELQRLSEQWETCAGFPGVVGTLDGTYIKITEPTEYRDAYICRKGFPAMHLQVVCAKDLRFIDVFTGYAGSVHDSRVFRNSDLRQLLESEEGHLPKEYHLLGDSAYPLKDYLLVPFRDNGYLTDVQKAYNSAHSQTRVKVESAIGLLKGKFRRLKDLDMTNPREIPYVIFAACVLHNFIIIKNGVDADDIDLSEYEGNREDGIAGLCAEDKRLAIAHRLA